MPDAPDQGAAQTRVSAALSPAPHRAPPPAQWPAAPDSSRPEEREPRSVLSSGVSATSRRLRTLVRGPKAVVERWAPRALAALPAWRLYSLLLEWLPHDHRRRPLGPKLGLPGVRRERWVRRCEGVSALGMHAGDGAQSSVILFTGRRQRVFRWDSLLFPKAFWRIRYKIGRAHV